MLGVTTEGYNTLRLVFGVGYRETWETCHLIQTQWGQGRLAQAESRWGTAVSSLMN